MEIPPGFKPLQRTSPFNTLVEVGLYTVRNGKIVREEFFDAMG